MRASDLTRPSPGWRAVFFIQRLIGRVAPPLHSLRWKIFALLLVGVFLPSTYFLWQVRLNLEPGPLKNLALPAVFAAAMAIGCAYLLSSYLTRVITDMATRANRIAAGEPGVRLETWTKSELGDLARALEAMRVRLEGKAYIEEMASTLSHELKTPLASIRGATEIVAGTDDPAVKEKFLGNICAEVDRLTHIVTNLLALSRIESLPASAPEVCQINAVAGEVVETFRARAEMLGLTLSSHMDPGAKTASLDAEALRRILTILLDNAFAFTPAGKSVHLETSVHTVTVRDQGCGVALDIQARIFERFFTTTNPLTGRRGTGLGLAIARSLAVRAGGTIALESQPDEGTLVTVTFLTNSISRHLLKSDGALVGNSSLAFPGTGRSDSIARRDPLERSGLYRGLRSHSTDPNHGPEAIG